ncbi:MAG: HD domain-containing protein [Fibrobacteria bacterium]|nr:HD domain-containing protein [Fibrobacteria bacterium]
MQSPELQSKLESLVRVGVALSSVRDLDELLERILDEAMSLSSADGASLYLRKGEELEFHIAHNRSLEAKMGRTGMSLFYERFSMPISRQSMAGYCALTGKSLNFPDVQALPLDSGFQYNPSFDKRSGYFTHSMLTVPMSDRLGQCVGVLQLINSMDNGRITAFSPVSEMLVQAFAAQAGVALVNAQLDLDLKKAHQETLFRLSSAAEYRDKETSNHIKRMSHFSRILARDAGLTRDQVDMIFCSSPMHDVGKIGIPDHILQKPGKLTPEERVIMESHAVIGAHILKDSEVPVVRQAALVALTHHEKWDGTGYPRRLAGEAIPLEGRIVALADVYDALSSRRCYKEPWSEDRVQSFLVDQRGLHFDPALVDLFLAGMSEIRQIQSLYQDSDSDLEKLTDFSKIPIPEL